jgi:hypothetical protein
LVELLLALLTTLTGIERTQDAELTALAQQRAVQIQTNFSHAGVPAGLAEIIAWNNSPDPVASFAAQWQDSPPHWAILTDPQYGAWGCGISSTADGRYWAACLFRSDGFIPPVIQPTAPLPNTALGDTSMIPFLQREPAVIAGTVIAVLQALILFNVIQLTVEQLAGVNTALIAVLTLFVRSSSTPTAAPTLAAGTEVSVKNTSDTVIVAPTPPGPVGVEGGTTTAPGGPTGTTGGIG